MAPRKITIRIIDQDLCSESPTCATCATKATVEEHPGVVYMIATQVTDPDALAAFATHIGPGEVLTTQPSRMHPEVV